MKLHRWTLLRLAIAALCIAAVVWTVARLGPRRLLEAAAQAEPLWLGLSLLPIGGRFLLWGLKWWLMVRREGRMPYRAALGAVLAGAFVNLTTPTAKLAGGVLRASLLRRRTAWTMARSYGWAFADQVTNVLGQLLLVAVLSLGSAAMLSAGPAKQSFLTLGSIAALCVVSAMVLRGVAGRPALGARAVRWMRRLLSQAPPGGGVSVDEIHTDRPGLVGQALAPLLGAQSATSRFVLDVILGSASAGLLCLANAMALRSLNVEVPLLVVAASTMIGYFAGTMVGVLGGIGATEVALIELYELAGAGDAEAAAGALLHRAAFYLSVLVFGGLALWNETRSSAR